MRAEILSYSRSRGLFAGVSLKGVVISQDNDMNQAIYGKTAKQLLLESPVICRFSFLRGRAVPQVFAKASRSVPLRRIVRQRESEFQEKILS